VARQPINLPVFVTLSDVANLKRRLGAAVRGTDESVQACAQISDPARASWGLFYAAALSYCNEPPHFFQSISAATLMNMGEAYEDELVTWQDKIVAGGCVLTVPRYDPGEQQKNQLDTAVQLVRWGTIAVVAVAGAYAVMKLAEAVPHVNLGGGPSFAPPTAGPPSGQRARWLKPKEIAQLDKRLAAKETPAASPRAHKWSVGYADRRGKFHVTRVRASSRTRAIMAARKVGDVFTVRFTNDLGA
jgi:hypothetical protein